MTRADVDEMRDSIRDSALGNVWFSGGRIDGEGGVKEVKAYVFPSFFNEPLGH